MHSANRQEGIPPTVHSVCICLSRLKARVGRNQVRLGPREARHCTTRIKEYVRANDLVGSFKVTKDRGNSTSPLRSKISVYSCLGSFIALLDVDRRTDRSDEGHYSLPVVWSIDPGLARGGRKYRIETWPLLMPL